jgi:hypothetical protein
MPGASSGRTSPSQGGKLDEQGQSIGWKISMALISARWAVMAGVSQPGMTRPAPLPAFGQMAPKI